MALLPKKMFFIDCIGAIVSTIFLGIIIPYFQSTFGMPKTALYVLAFIAMVFAIYSFFCYVFITKNWKPYIRIILFLNLAYCLLTSIMVYHYYEELTNLGVLYFVLEILIILILVITEYKTYKNTNQLKP